MKRKTNALLIALLMVLTVMVSAAVNPMTAEAANSVGEQQGSQEEQATEAGVDETLGASGDLNDVSAGDVTNESAVLTLVISGVMLVLTTVLTCGSIRKKEAK